jgi:hypothetical protein
MKKQILIVACLAGIFGAAISSSAQVGGVRVKVPFDFAVYDKTYPAGEYTMVLSPGQIQIEDGRGRVAAKVLANNISGRSAGSSGQMIFHCYRERCFLSEVWSPVQESGRQVLISKSEADVARRESGKYFALMGEKHRPQ